MRVSVPTVPTVPAAWRSSGFAAALERIGLPAWFVAIDLLWIAKLDVLAIDARHYQRAANTWLAGGNPWSVAEQGVPYASGPHTLLFYVPTSTIPLDASVAVWMLIGVLAAVWAVRRLSLPLWWVFFPPLAHAIWNGNPQTLVIALLVAGHPIASALAVAIKLYAGPVLLWRPWHLVVTGGVLAAALLVLPWPLYLDQGLGISHHLGEAWNGSAWRFPLLLLPPTLVGLWILRRKGAEWLIVPAAWPATQFYYVSMALPFVARRPLLAAAFALPVAALAALVVIGLAVREVFGDRLAARFPMLAPMVGPLPEPPPSTGPGS